MSHLMPRVATAPECQEAHNARHAVRLGVWVSAARCLFVYVVAPLAGGLGALFGMAGILLQVVGTAAAISGARTLWRRHHRARYAYAAVAVGVSAGTIAVLGQLLITLAQSSHR